MLKNLQSPPPPQHTHGYIVSTFLITSIYSLNGISPLVFSVCQLMKSKIHVNYVKLQLVPHSTHRLGYKNQSVNAEQ
jgi:hypothetical protein